jgi:pimeloyl-ACP methyl ester carboxylesterase
MPEALRARRAAWSAGVRRAGALLALAASVLAGVGAAAPQPAPGAPLPAAAEHWHLGSLDLAPCTVGAQYASWIPSQSAYCTVFDVPEDWDTPGGRHIGLRVAVVKASAAQADPDLVVFLDGGPGGAATQDYPTLAPALAPLRRRHHILLVDQRGTGGSNPLDCGEELYLEADKPTRPAPGAAARPAADAQRAAVRRCLDTLLPHAAPQFYTTTDAVRDLDAVRHALGDLPLDLVGVSYGTRMAQQYTRRHPEAVRTVVLDSPVPNRLALMSEHARNLEDALRQRMARCRQSPECARRFGDPYESLRLAQEHLRRDPQTVTVLDPQTFVATQVRMTAGDLTELVRFYLYSDTTSALLPLVASEARDGRLGPVLAQSQLVVGDVTEHLSSGMSASVLCAEDADLLTENPADVQTLLGAEAVRSAIDACAQWPHRPRPDDFHAPFETPIPVLVLSGEFDPVTPARYGAEIVGGLAHARQLLAPGQGHAVMGAGCMPKLMSTFVQTRDPARIDDACLKVLGDTPAFLTVNGAAP